MSEWIIGLACLALAAIPAYFNYRQRVALLNDIEASMRRSDALVRAYLQGRL